jgi:hypothetical protein
MILYNLSTSLHLSHASPRRDFDVLETQDHAWCSTQNAPPRCWDEFLRASDWPGIAGVDAQGDVPNVPNRMVDN